LKYIFFVLKFIFNNYFGLINLVLGELKRWEKISQCLSTRSARSRHSIL